LYFNKKYLDDSKSSVGLHISINFNKSNYSFFY